MQSCLFNVLFERLNSLVESEISDNALFYPKKIIVFDKYKGVEHDYRVAYCKLPVFGRRYHFM